MWSVLYGEAVECMSIASCCSMNYVVNICCC